MMPFDISPQWWMLVGLNLVACLVFLVVELTGVLRRRKNALTDDGASATETGTDEWWREWAESGEGLPKAADSCRPAGGAGRGGWVA